jgi:hypothetical protein
MNTKIEIFHMNNEIKSETQNASRFTRKNVGQKNKDDGPQICLQGKGLGEI